MRPPNQARKRRTDSGSLQRRAVPEQPEPPHLAVQILDIEDRPIDVMDRRPEGCLPHRAADRWNNVMEVLLPHPHWHIEVIAGQFRKIIHSQRAGQLDHQRQRLQRTDTGLDLLEPVRASPDQPGKDRPRHPFRHALELDPLTGREPH